MHNPLRSEREMFRVVVIVGVALGAVIALGLISATAGAILLAVANQTVGGRALLDEVKNHCRGRKCEVRVVVPALTRSYLEHWSSDVDGAIAEAQRRLDVSLRAMGDAGLRASGQVGD